MSEEKYTFSMSKPRIDMLNIQRCQNGYIIAYPGGVPEFFVKLKEALNKVMEHLEPEEEKDE